MGTFGNVFVMDVDNFGVLAFRANNLNGIAFAAFLAHGALLK
jgi:hypothetical protein